LLTALIVTFLAIALVKPWVGGALAPAPPFPTPAAAASPSIGPDPLAALREHCQEPLGWRVYSRETWLGREVRTWRSVEPVSRVTGPGDPAIPVVALGPWVEALGYCSPWTGAERPPADATVSAWRRGDAARGGERLVVVVLRAIAPGEPTPLGALYGAIDAGPDQPVEAATGWPAGRYVFAVRAADWQRWWVVEIAGPDATRTPRPAASPTP
jgi:hypothetical protein